MLQPSCPFLYCLQTPAWVWQRGGVEVKRTLKVFLASSGDVAAERDMVEAELKKIENHAACREWIQFDLERWDDEHRQVPFTAAHDMQGAVEEYKGPSNQAQLVIAIYKHRFGLPLPEAKYRLSPSGKPWTGTEWEVVGALQTMDAAKKAGLACKLDVMFFRSKEPFATRDGQSQQDKRTAFDQYMAVEEFFAGNAHGLNPGGENFYADTGAFAAVFNGRVTEWVVKHHMPKPSAPNPTAPENGPASIAKQATQDLTADQTDLHQRLLSVDVVRDKALLSRVRAAPIHSVITYLLHRYAHWALLEGFALQQHFVNLDLVTDMGRGFEGQRHERKPFKTLPDLLQAAPDAQAWLLVGDPGGGKSTLMQHYELTQAVATLRALAAPLQAGGERPELVIWQRLAEHRVNKQFDEAGIAIATEPAPGPWLGGEWARLYKHLPPLADLAQQFRLRWLLDGVNEIQCQDEEARVLTLKAWAAWADGAGAGPGEVHSSLPPIFSVRRRDLSSGLGSHTRQAAVSTWTADQQRAYCEQRLGPDNRLWPEIEKDAQLRDLSGNPFQLSAQCELVHALDRPARNRAELMSGLAWLRLRRAHAKGELNASGLLGREDQRELSDATAWKQPQTLLRLPNQGALVKTLDAQALAMHQASGGAALSVPCNQVATALPGGDEEGRPREAWLRATERLHLAEAGREFRFSHHLWQEFFAARGLCTQAPSARWLALLKAPELKPLDEVVNELGALDPLPGPGTTPWEETFKMAVLLSPYAAAWIEALMPVNLALAGRAAAALPEGWNAKLLGQLKHALLARSRDAAVDVRLRIEAGEALGLLGDDLRYEVIRSTAGVQVRLPNAEHWAAIPAGTYRIGSEREDKDSDGDEHPVTPVDLEAFEMAFAPVTNAEYECFMRAGGYDDERWWAWQGEEAMTWLKTGLRNQASEDQIRQLRNAFASDWNKALKQWPDIAKSPGDLEQIQGWLQLSESQFIAVLESNFGAAAPNGQPRFWDDSNFNHKLQPVVGVCCYEARAYARWLSQRVAGGYSYCLPTEAQWEAAARGLARSLWPHGPGEPQGAWALNAEAAHLRRTSPVGCFSQADRQGASVLGAPVAMVDLAGNVWEWCSNLYAPYPKGQFNQPSIGGARLGRAVRGGAWYDLVAQARPASRDGALPILRILNLGFRLVRCPIQNTEH
jgi:formylglycine-generating enzyme required for sulfatase activity